MLLPSAQVPMQGYVLANMEPPAHMLTVAAEVAEAMAEATAVEVAAAEDHGPSAIVLEWDVHTTDCFLPKERHHATLQLPCSQQHASALCLEAAKSAAAAKKPRSPITAPTPTALPAVVPSRAGIRALRLYLHHHEAAEHGRLFQAIMYTRPAGSASRAWLHSSASLILQQPRLAACVGADASSVGLDGAQTHRWVADGHTRLQAHLGRTGGCASTTSLLRALHMLRTQRLYACRVAPALVSGLELPPTPSCGLPLAHPAPVAMEWAAPHQLLAKLDALGLGHKHQAAHEWCQAHSVHSLADMQEATQQVDFVDAMQLSGDSMKLMRELASLCNCDDNGYPRSFWCPIDCCPMPKCNGWGLTFLQAKACYLLGQGFVKEVSSVSAYCKQCGCEVGPWDTEANEGVEVHSLVAFTLPWRMQAVAEIEEMRAPGVVARDLFHQALRAMSDGSGRASPQISKLLSRRKQQTIIEAAADGLGCHMGLREGANMCAGKVACPKDGAFTPVVVMDGTRHQVTKLTAQMLRKMAANARPDEKDAELADASWHSMVSDELERLRT